jgi:AAA+ superfamily predicted ATPase
MQVNEATLNRHSEEDFAKSLLQFSDAGAGIIHVRTKEILRATIALRKAILVGGNPMKEWDIVHGWRTFDLEHMYTSNYAGDKNIQFFEELEKPMAAIEEAVDDGKFSYFVYVNPQYWLDNSPISNHWLHMYSHLLPSTQVRVILLTPDEALPEVVVDTAVVVQFEAPGYRELMETLDEVLEGVEEGVVELNDEDKQRICYTAAGMPKEEYEMFTALSIVRGSADNEVVDGATILAGVAEGKTTIVNQNDLLELYHPEDMSHVGGMANLKEWIAKRKNCYGEEAAAYGISPPKGIVFVGPPGTGKSLTAKAVGSELGIPIVRLDFGRVFNSLVGKSEERVRTALRMVEIMAPCVLFVDEIDKGLGGISSGGGGDSGTSQRVLGTFLTWLQDNTAPVFTMVTANNVDGLPPELMRKGRFDEIFASGMPGDNERKDILEIHLRKRGHDMHRFGDKAIAAAVEASKGFVGSEIEQAVEEGLTNAFDEGVPRAKFSLRYVRDALAQSHPLAKAHEDVIGMMTLWAQKNARPAGEDYLPVAKADASTTTAAAEKGTRRVSTRKRNSGK